MTLSDMTSSDSLFELPALYHTLQNALGTHAWKQHDKILQVCQNIQHIAAQEPCVQTRSFYHDVGVSIFSLLCNFSKFERAKLFEHEDSIMNTALMLYNILPPENFGTTHLCQLVQHATVAVAPHTARNTLICAILNGPKDHWALTDTSICFQFSKTEILVAEENYAYRDQPIALTSLLVKALAYLVQHNRQKCAQAHETLHSLIHSLLFQDRLKLYPEIFPFLDGKNVIKSAIYAKKQYDYAQILNNFDAMICDDDLQRWFPDNNLDAQQLAQDYPHLFSFLEKRAISNCLTTPSNATKRKI